MSNKKHKGDHGKRAERHAAAQNQPELKKSASAEKPRRVFLRNWLYIWATFGIVAACAGVATMVGVLGWWENTFVSIVTILVGAFGCMCVYDLALLLTDCISFGDGMVNAGKNQQGQQMIFHASSVTRLEMRDKTDKPLPDTLPLYKDAELVFVMDSGRINRKKVSRLTRRQYAKIREALEAEKKFEA